MLQPYASQLEQYVTLLNQIATLNNRVGLMQSLVTNTPSFNPETFLDLLSYLDPLENIYTADRSTLLGNLESCLAATSANVTTVCGPIIDNQATDAFEYYATFPTSCAAAGDCFFAQQNTLALPSTSVWCCRGRVKAPRPRCSRSRWTSSTSMSCHPSRPWIRSLRSPVRQPSSVLPIERIGTTPAENPSRRERQRPDPGARAG